MQRGHSCDPLLLLLLPLGRGEKAAGVCRRRSCVVGCGGVGVRGHLERQDLGQAVVRGRDGMAVRSGFIFIFLLLPVTFLLLVHGKDERQRCRRTGE
jgi:hypothetical protein